MPFNFLVESLAQYIVTATLGQGTFGKVKLATHQETGQDCTLPPFSRCLATRPMSSASLLHKNDEKVAITGNLFVVLVHTSCAMRSDS
jgi:serine/threonine protein kinase